MSLKFKALKEIHSTIAIQLILVIFSLVMYRRAALYEETDKLDECMADYNKIIELDPTSIEARAHITRLKPIVDERNERLKAEMMGKLKDLGNMILKPFGLSTNNFQMQQDPNTGSYSVNFQQNSGS